MKRASILLSLILMLCFQATYAATGTILTTTEEFNFIPATGFQSTEPYTQIWHFGNSTYIVWVDAKQRAWVTQVTNGTPVTAPIDTGADYLVQADGHHRFSLGLDKNGYIHVTGDMHHYSDFTTAVITPYPLRYQEKKILYWRSTKPNDVTGGFTFEGDSFTTAMQGGGWMMGRFFTDNNGELFYSSQAHAYESSNSLGQMAVGLYKYNVSTQAWTAIGGIVTISDPYLSHQYPVFYWENAGVSGGWFQNYQANFKFDKNNNMYFVVSGNTQSSLANPNRVLFAMSTDGGTTWKKANGQVLGALPLRGVDGLSSSADVVEDGGTTTSYPPFIGMEIDNNNQVNIGFNNKWVSWNGSAWVQTSAQNITNLPVMDLSYRTNSNQLLMSTNAVNKVLWTPDFSSASIGYDFLNYTAALSCIDAYSLLNSNTLYGLNLRTDNVTQAALKTTVVSAPLPANWNFIDMDSTTLPYGGNAGFLNNQFVMTSYGVGISDQNDSMTYAYTNLTQDGSVTARVSNMQTGYSRAGVMIRETLASNSKEVSMLLGPVPKQNNAIFSVRDTTGAYSDETQVSGIVAPYWVRVTKAGSVFTGYISADGATWKQVGTANVSMASNIYVGLGISANQNKWFMNSATFDNVTVPTSTTTCVAANPTLTLSPSTQSGTAGSKASYVLSVKNNDSASCASGTFALTDALPSGFTGTLSASSLSLAPGSSGTANITLSSSATTTANTYSFTATATHGSYTGTASASYIVTTPGCVTAAPQLSISPTTSTTYGSNPAYYVISLTSQDSATCPGRIFNFDTSITGSFSTWMEPFNVLVAPGKKVLSLITVTPQKGATAGTYQIASYTQQGGTANASLIYQNAPAAVINVASDKAVYARTAKTFNAVLTASVVIGNTTQKNLVVVAKLTYPDGTSKSIVSTTGNGSLTANFAVQQTSLLGIYTYQITTIYNKVTYSNQVMFSVQ